MLIYFVIMKERMSKCTEACITWKIKSLSFIACVFFFFESHLLHALHANKKVFHLLHTLHANKKVFHMSFN